MTANLVPGAMAALCRAAREGRWDAAEEIQAHLQPLHRELMAEPNPIPIKTLLHQLGRIGSGIRRPLVPASETLTGRLLEMVRKNYQSELL